MISAISILSFWIFLQSLSRLADLRAPKQECLSSQDLLASISKTKFNILVTGGAGFVGMHVCLQLVRHGHSVTAFDSMNEYYSIELKNQRKRILQSQGINFVQGNVCNSGFLLQTLQTYNIDRVVHLAAQAGVRYSLTHPQEYVQNNVACFVSMLETYIAANLSKNSLVYASSSSVYGLNQKVPFSEDDIILNPASLYAATKNANEVIARAYFNLYGLKSVGLRFFTVYGPWGRPDMAYYTFAQKMLNNETIQVFDHGKSMRDYTFIDDIVHGIVAALFTEFASPQIFNLGNNSPVQMMYFLKTLQTHLQIRAKLKFVEHSKGDVPVTFANVSKAACLLAYDPKTKIDDGLKKFVEWFTWYSKQLSQSSGKITSQSADHLEYKSEPSRKNEGEQLLKANSQRADHLARYNENKKTDSVLPTRMANGCRHVFLDLGANIGMHTRFLFEKVRYSRSPYQKIFDKWFGSERHSVCAFAFEPNPEHVSRHRLLEKAYNPRGWHYRAFSFAVGSYNGTQTMYKNARREKIATGQNRTWMVGFSTVDREFDRKGADSKYNLAERQQKVVVPVVDIAEFIDQQVIGRRYSKTSKSSRPPAVVIKMDIEGSEFEVLNEMLRRGILCRGVSYLSLEWHTQEKFLPISTLTWGVIKTSSQASKIKSQLLRRIKALSDGGMCSFQISEVDDESYYRDGFPIDVQDPPPSMKRTS